MPPASTKKSADSQGNESIMATDSLSETSTNQGSPRRNKQVERDFAMVLASMPHGRVATTAEEGGPASASTTASNNNNHGSLLGKRSPGKNRRPYRRTKRPKDYCGLSTITTATSAAEQKSNVYDTVLGEAEDLLKAATESQSLGRLKMASNYLLLLHTRLVGLGMKFDRAKTVDTPVSVPAAAAAEEPSLKPAALFSKNKSHSLPGSPVKDRAQSPARKKQVPVAQTPSPKKKKSPYGSPPSNGVSEAALNQLKNLMMDQGMLVDQAMVEHLARAAAELHQNRTGKRHSEDGLLNSPAMNTEEVFHYNKDNNKDSWTAEEQRKFQEAVHEVGSASDPAKKIAKIMGTRTEAQVKAYLEKKTEKDTEDTPRKKGGRGRKPPTTAINTVPNANLDAKAMLGGFSLGM